MKTRPIRPMKKKGSASSTGADASSMPASVSAPVTHKLQKVLAQAGLGSRREMEELIAAGGATINGKVAVIGDRAGPDDTIRVGKRTIHFKSNDRLPRVVLYHKPEGEIVSHDDPEGRPSVFAKLPQLRSSKWISIGRLDYNTSGLLIFTTDGELANRLMHPRFEVEREYAVRIMGRLTPEVAALLTTGVELEDGLAKFDHLSDQGGEGSNHWYRVILKEGRNREVRRMFETVGMTVSRLMRVRFGPINLPPRLKRGKWMELDETEIRRLLALVA
ncbi:23S rRNA pseudouridine(2605) synthase RluB [Nitrosospira sp. NpAV]|uniref:23S rRNA pseudouridine(2605) synthase RluB n=1 Tax=Nitrosospira sp. NpAV TaxID=58133 RepID=UPI0005A22E13|nr:pseudouridine synthase [Nitrosospira sp. NpAV]KIO47891.1 pseudouridine synthase [Nitrosospira sp. NpAV]